MSNPTTALNNWLQSRQQQAPDTVTPLLRETVHALTALSSTTLFPLSSDSLETSDKRDNTQTDAAIQQGLAMANTLCPLHSNDTMLAGALLFPAYDQDLITEYHLRKLLPKHETVLLPLLEGVKQFADIRQYHDPARQHTPISSKQAENLRRLILSMAADIRIVLIKLAERLTLLQRINALAQSEQTSEQRYDHQHTAELVLLIHAPLANRLGIGQLKWQLEDLAFRCLNPKTYQSISKGLVLRREAREAYIEHVKMELTQRLTEQDISSFQVSGRPKHIYGIYKKLERKQVTLDEIYDTSALRVLVPNLETCYSVLSIIHSSWSPITAEFDDYIANPKPNGYRSIHTAVVGPDQHHLEIQIRTYAMHEEAELGVAAHWRYKAQQSGHDANTPAAAAPEPKSQWLKEMIDWEHELSQTRTADLFAGWIYVFSPKGDIVELPEGATPLDFAYHIHTDIGHRCRGAKVNGKLVPLSQPLSTCDQVQIITVKAGDPSRDWLNETLGYLKTASARSKVKTWFRKQDAAAQLALGQQIWEKYNRKYQYTPDDLKRAVSLLNSKSLSALFIALGAGTVQPIQVHHACRPAQKPEIESSEEDITAATTRASSRTTSSVTPSSIIVAGVDNLLTQLAQCCKPIPGDPIAGYVTQGRGVSIHHAACRNIKQAQHTRSERLIDAKWSEQYQGLFAVDLLITANQRPGLVRDITQRLAQAHILLLGIQARVDKSHAITRIKLTVEINQIDRVDQLIRELKEIPDIETVQRCCK